MKIIFLDIDGVLCTFRAHYAQGCPAPNGILHALDREAVGLTNALGMGFPGEPAQFVVISTWRSQQHPVGKGGPVGVVHHLRHYGWMGLLHGDWCTRGGPLALEPGSEKHRGAEVAEWLSRHPAATDYVILDDGEHFLPEQADRHVRPDYANGLMWEDFKKSVRILHGIEGLKP